MCDGFIKAHLQALFPGLRQPVGLNAGQNLFLYGQTLYLCLGLFCLNCGLLEEGGSHRIDRLAACRRGNLGIAGRRVRLLCQFRRFVKLLTCLSQGRLFHVQRLARRLEGGVVTETRFGKVTHLLCQRIVAHGGQSGSISAVGKARRSHTHTAEICGGHIGCCGVDIPHP